MFQIDGGVIEDREVLKKLLIHKHDDMSYIQQTMDMGFVETGDDGEPIIFDTENTYTLEVEKVGIYLKSQYRFS